MADLTSITGKALLDRKVMIQMLSALEPSQLDKNSGLYDIGYERAKADLLNILAQSLGEDYKVSPSVRLIRELRRDRGA